MMNRVAYERAAVVAAFFVLAAGLLVLTACGGASGSPPVQTSAEVVDALVEAGLEAEDPSAMGRDDYGMGPYVGEGTHFFLYSLCEDCGGRAFVTESAEDAERLKAYYDELGKSSAMLYSHTFQNDQILLQLNGDMDDARAAEYGAVIEQLVSP